MARKKVSRALTPLPNKRALEDAPHKTERLIEILRGVVLKNQHEQPRAFYSMRDVATRFHVPVSTVSRAYRHLEQEGLLNSVRGSKTILQGLHFDRHLSVRAFIGLPASLSAFVTLQAYRTFFIRIRRELRLRGFASAMAFSEKEEASSLALSERLKAYEIDTVLWFQPPREAREIALRLSDLGIRLIGVAHDQFPIIPCRYHVRRDSAIRVLLAEWKAHNAIDHVTLVHWSEHRSPALEETVNTLLNEFEIKSSVINIEDSGAKNFCAPCKKRKLAESFFPQPSLPRSFVFAAQAS